jgi:DNA-binding NarL/FixJ family response regulator
MSISARAEEVVSVVICDDDELACRALRLLLEEPGIEIVATCQTPESCLRAVRERPPHVAVIDLQLGGNPRAGVELIRQVRAASPSTLCLVLTATDAKGQLLPEAFLAGAHGFQRKGYVSGVDLPALVRRMVAGDWEIDHELAAVLVQHIEEVGARQAPSHAAKDADVCLMPAEVSVLRLVAAGTDAPAISAKLGLPPDMIQRCIRNITGKYHQASSPVLQLCRPNAW